MSSLDLRLADHIIGQHFGETSKKVAHALAAKGPLTTAQIGLATKLPARSIRESLFVLIHHNLVLWRLPKDELGIQQQHQQQQGPPAIFQLALDRVLLRLAYPNFVSALEERHGKEAGEAVMEIMKVGRCASEILEPKLLQSLLSEGLIEYVDAMSSRFDQDEVDSSTVASANASGSATPSPSKKRKAATASTAASPIKAKKVKFSEDSSTTTTSSNGKRYVRIVVQAFVILIWYDQLIQHASRRINNAAGSVLEAVLKATGPSSASTGKTLLNSFAISHKLPAGTPLLLDSGEGQSGKGRGVGSALASYLEAMSQDLPYFIKSGEQAGGQFYLDFPSSIDLLVKNCLLAHITARFGQASARIFRIILDKKYLEERFVAKLSMLSGKEARERLFILLQHGFVHIQEVPKTADHAPSRTIFLWTVPMDRLRSQSATTCKKVIVNLLERIQHERGKYRLLIAKTERTDVAANPAALLSSLERAQLEALNHVLGRLEFQITNVMIEYLILAHLK